MAWVRPTSHTSPVPEWDNPEKAYDGSVGSTSYADCDKQDVGTFIYINRASTSISKIRIAASAFKTIAYVLQCDIDLYYNSQWNHLFDNFLTYFGATWNEIEIGSSQDVTAIRVQSRDGARQARIYEIEWWEEEGLSITGAGGIASLEAFGTPTITFGTPLAPPGIASLETFDAPKLSLNVKPAFISSTESFYQPTVTQTQNIGMNFIASTEALYNPAVAGPIGASFIDSTEAVYNPTVTPGNVNIAPAFISSAETLYQPTATPGNVNISPAFIASAEVVYQPTTTTQSTVEPQFISSAEALYNPAVTPGNVNVEPQFIASSETFYQPTIIGSVIYITNAGGIASVEEFDAPKILHVVKVSVAASSDDCDVYASQSGWYLRTTSKYICVGCVGSDDCLKGGGMRFLSVAIPSGAIVESAHLVLEADGTEPAVTVNSEISGEDVDSAATFSDLTNYSNRRGIDGGSDNRTTAKVSWNSIPSWTSGFEYTSPDIKTIIQEIVDRSGWNSGQNIVLFWDDHAGSSSVPTERVACGYLHSTGEAETLIIKYTAPTLVEPNFISSEEALYQPDVTPGNVNIGSNFIASAESLYQPEVIGPPQYITNAGAIASLESFGTHVVYEWVSPTGHVDPDTEWINENLAYDGDTGTKAQEIDVAATSWSSFLELTIDTILCTSINTYLWGGPWGNMVDEVDIDIYYDSAWHHLYEGEFKDGTSASFFWNVYTFAEQYVSALRIRLHNAMGLLLDVECNEIWFGKIYDTRKYITVAGAIPSLEAFGTAQLNQFISSTFTNSAELMYQPTVVPGNVNISPSFISSAEVMYQPEVIKAIVPVFIASSEALYQPTVTPGNVDVSPQFISSSEVLYQPEVIPGGVQVDPSFITSEETFYQSEVFLAQLIECAFILSEETFYNPSLSLRTIEPTFITSSEVLYQPSVAGPVNMNFITSSEILYNPAAGNYISAGFIASIEALYEPSLIYDQIATPNFISDGALYQPTVTPGNVDIGCNFITSLETCYQPTVLPGGVQVDLQFVDTTEELYLPTATPGNVDVDPAFISSGEALYQPAVTQLIECNFITSSEAFYSPRVWLGLEIYPSFITSGEVMYVPELGRQGYYRLVSFTFRSPKDIDFSYRSPRDIDLEYRTGRNITFTFR